MRKHLLLVGIALALLWGGWGGVLAAATCPHAENMRASATASDADHACCLRKAQAHADTDCHTPELRPESVATHSHHEEAGHATSGTHAKHAANDDDNNARTPPNVSRKLRRQTEAFAATGRKSVGGASRRASYVAPPVASCAHCAIHSQSAPPTLKAREANGAGRENSPPQLARRVQPTPPAPVDARFTHTPQKSPPGTVARRHLLLNTFLI